MFKNKYNIKKDTKIILYIGRIHKSKRIDLLIKAYSKIHNILDDSLLIISGFDDGYIENINQLIKSLNLDNRILLLEPISDEEKLMAYRDAYVFVTPAYSGFPMTFLEVGAIGTPIITTTLGDKINWIDNQAGIVSKPKVECLSQALINIFRNENRHYLYSRNSREIINSDFGIESVVDKLERTYREVLATNKISFNKNKGHGNYDPKIY